MNSGNGREPIGSFATLSNGYNNSHDHADGLSTVNNVNVASNGIPLVSTLTPAPRITSWDDVCQLVTSDDEGKWDRFVPRDELRMEYGQLGFPRRYSVEEGSVVPASLRLTNWSTLQLCQRLGIPVPYFRRCPTSLQDDQVNHFLRHSEKEQKADSASETQWLLRAKGATLRGLLSDRYSRVGNAHVLDALTPALQEVGYGVRWFALTDESLHLRLVDPRRIREVLPGDAVIAGLHVTNSEVGKRSITVDTMVWRLVCQNGLVGLVKGKNLFARRHIGLSLPELAATLPSVVRQAVLEGEAVVDRMALATTHRLSDPEGVVATIASDWNLSQAMEERIIASLVSEPWGQQETLYGVVNAITQVAQGLLPDERYALEALAGTLLESGPPAVRAEPRSRKSDATDSPTENVRGYTTENLTAETSREPRLALFGPDW